MGPTSIMILRMSPTSGLPHESVRHLVGASARARLTSRDGGNAGDCREQSLPSPRSAVHPEHNGVSQVEIPVSPSLKELLLVGLLRNRPVNGWLAVIFQVLIGLGEVPATQEPLVRRKR